MPQALLGPSGAGGSFHPRNPRVGNWLTVIISKLNSLYAAQEEDINQVPVTERDRSFVELNILDQLHSLRKITEVTDAIN